MVVVVAEYPLLDGSVVRLIARPLGWDAPCFRDPVTGRDGLKVGVVVPRRRDSRVLVLPRPGPAREAVQAQAP